MARKKDITLKDELIKLEQEVEKFEAKIKELTDKKKKTEELIEKKQMEALHKAVVESGKTIDEAIALINDGQAEQQECN